MITNKDISIDKDGSIILNGDKYPLASQAEIDVITATIGDITQSGVTGADVATQIGALQTEIGDITQSGVTGADVAAQIGALDTVFNNIDTIIHRYYINAAGGTLLTDINVNQIYTTGFIAIASSHATYNSGRISAYLGGVARNKEDGTVGGIASTRLGSVGAGDGTDGDNLTFTIEDNKLKLTANQYQSGTSVTIIMSTHA